MSEVLDRARKARRDARDVRAASLLRAAGAHDRAATIARNAARLGFQGRSHADASLELARQHEISALVLRRRALRLTQLRRTDPEVNVHLGFRDASCREDVLALLHDLGGWEGGELTDLPHQGAYFRVMTDDLVLAEVAVRERLRFALASLGGWEQLVTVHAVWPQRL